MEPDQGTQSIKPLEYFGKPSHKNCLENTAVQKLHKWKIITWDSDFPSLSLLVSQSFNISLPPIFAHSARGRGPPERVSPSFAFSKSFRHTFKCNKLYHMRLDNSNSHSIQEQFQTGLCASHQRASTILKKIINTHIQRATYGTNLQATDLTIMYCLHCNLQTTNMRTLAPSLTVGSWWHGHFSYCRLQPMWEDQPLKINVLNIGTQGLQEMPEVGLLIISESRSGGELQQLCNLP